MTKLLTIIIFLLSFVYASDINSAKQTQHIKWHWDYEKALVLAKQEQKPILLFLQIRDPKDCPKCKKMLFETLCNQKYIDFINNHYICIVAFYEDKDSYPIELFYTQEFPSLFLIKSEDESLLKTPIFGYMSSNQFRNYLFH